jgi:hypothetical protein
VPLENTRLALAGAEFHPVQICTGRVALMRPFLISALAAGKPWPSADGRARKMLKAIADVLDEKLGNA